MSPPTSPLPRSLNRQAVLDEDEYTAALSHIIARDFFPSLVHLDATNDYLDALRSEDPQLIHASVRRLEQLSTPATRSGRTWQTPSQTPYGLGPSETPLRTPRSEAPAKRARYDTDMNLDAFQARYTSEDNSSFTEILDDENRKRREKWSWAWEAQKKVEAQKERLLEDRKRSLIEAAPGPGVREKFLIENPTPAGLITDGRTPDEENKKSDPSDSSKGKEVALHDQGHDETDVMAPKKDKRPAGVDGWHFKARNALMFPPDADVTPYDAAGSSSKQDSEPVVPKVIKYNSTRLPEQEASHRESQSEPPSPTRSRIDAAIAGTPYRPKSPTINNFSLVPAVPSPTPSQLGPAAVKQLMTWGTITATPRVLDPEDDAATMPPPKTPFHIPAPTSREALSHKLSANAAKSLKAKAGLLSGSGSRASAVTRTPGPITPGIRGRKGSMPPPSWTPRKIDATDNLTPAARRLLDKTTMGTAAVRRAEAMGRTAGWEGNGKRETDLNRVRWTPTPSPVTRR
ncbi:hypothetical protein GLOTRDRAFT_68567 [Gloeophyllum trabeum ATCC 11539]|uniref:Nuclear protein DGCR14 n=1 Tax=Gloeophyllum trabeum (strain ATCC 11539 / FP-39264 / Madison 617) TaxID=670483 RepID=S7S035_GLOTA|nr:uncharacterized protein GLOTRDRAFT_68567 [Gloeophyllum trabeum ATCC 11539]EPQ60700.1 hypothetical protein GLOTRDRAFT_68567 [Gloeophyllum trabeum ATCC 11539]